MDINQDHQELSHTKPHYTKLDHKIIYTTSWWTMYIGEAFPNNAYDTECMQLEIQRCLYIMLYMPCKMQEMHKGNYTYATKKLPHTNSRNQTHTKFPPQTRESCLI
jgi:hypothetical protein